MDERIKELRKSLGLNQADFGKRIGVAPNTISTYENGSRALSDAIIMSICREFGVNEDWLRTGNGDMFWEEKRKLQVGERIKAVLFNRPDSFQAQLLTVLLRYNPDGPEFAALQKIARDLAEEAKKDPEP